LQWVFGLVHAGGKANIVCLVPPGQDEVGWASETLSGLQNVAGLGTTAFWALRGEAPQDCVERIGSKLMAEAKTLNLRSHLWVQGFRIPAGREDEIARAAEAALTLPIDALAIWGFDACSPLSELACDRPGIAWKAFLDAL
jgi:hypothetical protein